MLPVHPPQELKARSCGVMERSAFAQRVVEHRASQMPALLHICSGIHDHIDRHRHVTQYQAGSDHFLKSIYDGREDDK
jgi:hypothetical protein